MGTIIITMKSLYFSHDFDSRTDIKIRNLIRAHGMTGYGIYWALVEDLYRNANAMRTHYDLYAFEMRVDEGVIRSVINDFDLFNIDGDTFSSDSVERRINDINERSNKAATSAKHRWNKEDSERNANAMQTHSDSNANKNKNKNKIIHTHTIGDAERLEIFQSIQKNNPELNLADVEIETGRLVAFFSERGWTYSNGRPVESLAAAAANWTIKKPKNNNINENRQRIGFTEAAAKW